VTHVREDIGFRSGGEEIAAWLYRPEGAAPEGGVPCVVMAHGFSATRRDRLPAYAERFADAGFAVLLFDYRGFGDSGGEPRQVISIGRQHEDYEAAIATARGLEGIDPQRIALFGSSFSGGHVVAVASRHPEIAAVIAQVPFADGLAQLRIMPPRVAARGTLEGIRDVIASLRGREPVMIAPVGPPGSHAVMTAPEAEPGFAAITGEDSRWQNRVGARIMLAVASYRPVARAAHVCCPLLVQVGDLDETTPPEPGAKLALRAPRGELLRYPAGHFDPYNGEMFERFVGDQIAFLTRVLAPQRAAVAA
jgi:pimeloyl-ACP methyl ester carboxylesterase